MRIQKKIKWLVGLAAVSSAFIVGMYITSEHQMHHENPFLRRYITGSAEMAEKYDLRNRTMYFIGTDGSQIYLGDTQAPLHVFAFDTLLKSKSNFKIRLESDKFPFQRVQVQIMPPYFYVLDGSVPVIFKGEISDWNAKLLMHGNSYFFTHAEVINEHEIAFRSFKKDGRGTTLGRLIFTDNFAANYAPALLQKQIDGFFDVDGMMKYNSATKQLIYTYYYRNQFIVADDKLELQYRGNTIDTNAIANLKVSYNNETGERQLASPSVTVNRLMALSGKRLFVNSAVPGRYEDAEIWQQASTVDVYDLSNNTYSSSFYVYRFDEKLNDMLATGSSLYVIVGHHLQRYALSRHLQDKNNNRGKIENLRKE